MQEYLKQEYIKMRNSGQFNMTLFWDIYQDEGGLLKNPHEFTKHFLNEVESMGGGMEINTPRDRNQILLSIDKKLELTSLYDINGQFLKIIN